ncbi:MAG TPA: S41 family peptidase, partial [Minicystis sp.]|nr:S41 family peptidase [Minicystis sp.]
AASVAALAGPARAGAFLPDGTFEFDPAAVATFDFEGKAPMGTTTKAAANALSGEKVLAVQPFQGVNVAVTLPKSRATYRVSMWGNAAEIVGTFELSYSGGHTDDVAALYPTGRVTSDGWIEVANDHIAVDGAALTNATVSVFAPNGAIVDAVEIVPDGDAGALPETPHAACDSAVSPNPCGVGQLCMWSECRDVSGWVPPIPADRDDVADYMASRMKLLFGPYLERAEDLPASLEFVAAMKNAEDPYTYWGSYMAGVRRLHDGHTTTQGIADFVLQNPRPLNFCAIEGDADLSHDTAPKDAEYLDVLVSHVGADHTLGLKPGDRIVHVDGQHPIAWARSLLPVYWAWPTTSNHTTYAELASSLRSMISRFAKTIDVIRCDAEHGTCGPLETIDISALPFESDTSMVDFVDCDNRPLRHLASAPADHHTGNTVYQGIVNESQPGENIYGMEWESLYTTTGTDGVGPDLSHAVATWQSDARGVILDHRTGYGGTILAPEIIWNFAVPTHDDDAYKDRTFADEEQPSLTAGQSIFQAAITSGTVQVCGSATPDTSVPVALLITEDVSASDWLPQGLKGAPNTKIFGPFQTNGGFSTRYALGYWLSLSYVMAVGDDFLPDGSTHNGHGVEPDVVVLPRQSDLVEGKDSVYEVALEWVRGNLKP